MSATIFGSRLAYTETSGATPAQLIWELCAAVTLETASRGASGRRRARRASRVLGGGTRLRVCLSRTPSTRMGAAARRRPAAAWTTGSCRAGRQTKVNRAITESSKVVTEATASVFTCPSACPMGELRMKSVGAKTSTSATASSFSCKRPQVEWGVPSAGPRAAALASYLSAEGQDGRLEQLGGLLPAHVAACGASQR